MTVYVPDASAGADLLDTTVGRALLPRLEPRGVWWVPEHYFAEVASVVRRAELNELITEVTVDHAIRSLQQAPLRRAQVRPLIAAAWARRHNLTVYDALYVVLAEHLGATLVTTDLRLAATPNLGVDIVQPA